MQTVPSICCLPCFDLTRMFMLFYGRISQPGMVNLNPMSCFQEKHGGGWVCEKIMVLGVLENMFSTPCFPIY